GSLLNTKGTFVKSTYYKHGIDLNRPVWKLLFGVRENTEHNELHTLLSDTLTPSSFSFREYSAYISTGDSLLNKLGINYKKRYDDGVGANRFSPATEADEVSLSIDLAKKQSNQLRIFTSYRKLKVIDSLLTQQEEAKTLLNQINHTLSLWKGVISAITY